MLIGVLHIADSGSPHSSRIRTVRFPQKGLSPVHACPGTLGRSIRVVRGIMSVKRQIIPVVGLLATIAIAGYMVVQLKGEGTTPPSEGHVEITSR